MSWTLFSQIALLMVLAAALFGPAPSARSRKDKTDGQS
jgi:hypothetical protein